MQSGTVASGFGRKPRWYLIPVRALLVTFLTTLLAFAVSTLASIIVIAIYSAIRGQHPNFSFGYLHIAVPFAIGVGAVVLVLSLLMEIRHYRQTKVLASIERAV